MDLQQVSHGRILPGRVYEDGHPGGPSLGRGRVDLYWQTPPLLSCANSGAGTLSAPQKSH